MGFKSHPEGRPGRPLHALPSGLSLRAWTSTMPLCSAWPVGGWSMSKERRRILEEARVGDPVALARALVATPSVNPELEESGTGEVAVAELTAGWLRAWGLSVEMSEVAPERWNVVGRLAGNGVGPTLLLNGHLDTVGAAAMSVDPFGAELRDGRLWGRGACDMKGQAGSG